MRRLLLSTALVCLLAAPSLAAAQEDTLAKIKRTSAITRGFTESSAPFSSVGAGGIKKDLALSQLDVKWAKVTARPSVLYVPVRRGFGGSDPFPSLPGFMP